MVLPLLLGAGAILGATTLVPGATDAAGNAVGSAVEASVSVIGPALVATATGTYEAIKDEAKGHGVELATIITCIGLSFAAYLAARKMLA